MENFRIRPLSEPDIDTIVRAAGGCRAHADADKRDKPGSDYLLEEAVIELKALDEEGLAKPERQRKLSTLFLQHNPNRPVIVLDREALPEHAHRAYDRILEGPIKTAVAKANAQLKQSRAEHPSANTAILFLINNGYTALNHEALVRMVAHRVRQDTHEIDGVVVGGCYYYSDTFDSYFLWPIDYVPINISRPFSSFEKLRNAWNGYAQQFMTEVVLGKMPVDSIKGPLIDVQFDLDGIRYVKPAPPMGKQSEFFGKNRPRQNSTEADKCPSVATTSPDLAHQDWEELRSELPDEPALCEDYEHWQAQLQRAAAVGTVLRPFVRVRITCAGWRQWCATSLTSPNMASVRRYANELFNERLRATVLSARERSSSPILPARYILAITEEIGQDRANDVSHIAAVREMLHGEPMARDLVVNARIFHEYALVVAAAYAVAEGVEFVLWEKSDKYAWH